MFLLWFFFSVSLVFVNVYHFMKRQMQPFDICGSFSSLGVMFSYNYCSFSSMIVLHFTCKTAIS